MKDQDSYKSSMIQNKKNVEQVQGCLKCLVQSLSCYIMRYYYNCNIARWQGNRMKMQMNWWAKWDSKPLNVFTKKETRLKEQFINSVSDEEMMTEMIRELTAIKESNKITS